jgi:hypothetical protein
MFELQTLIAVAAEQHSHDILYVLLGANYLFQAAIEWKHGNHEHLRDHLFRGSVYICLALA